MKVKRLLMLALAAHLIAVSGIYLVGRLGVSGGVSADGIAAFASDSRVYRLQVVALTETLRREGIKTWLQTPSPPHVKLYSLSNAVFSPVFGQNILSVEPLNLFYYLATLLLIFSLGREVYGEREGLFAAGAFAVLYPSFLLHTTQLLKDPLFVVLSLLLVLVSVRWLTRRDTLAQGVASGAVGGLAAGSLWLVKNSVWWLVLIIILLGVALAVVELTRRRTLANGNLMSMALTLLIAVSTSYLVTPYWLPSEYWMPHRPGAGNRSPAPAAAATTAGDSAAEMPERGNAQTSATPESNVRAGAGGLLSRAAGHIGRTRAQFIELYPDAGSNIDTQKQFYGAADVARYLPRAALVGLCAPFPNMWLRAGENVGTGGRLLSGAETLSMYVIVLLAFQSLWHRRRQLSAWLLMLIALTGVLALGMVVVNVGALYRQRYLFWILFVIVGADAMSRVYGWLRARRARRIDLQTSHEAFRAAPVLK